MKKRQPDRPEQKAKKDREENEIIIIHYYLLEKILLTYA